MKIIGREVVWFDKQGPWQGIAVSENQDALNIYVTHPPLPIVAGWVKINPSRQCKVSFAKIALVKELPIRK
jgi:hypothetical protein